MNAAAHAGGDPRRSADSPGLPRLGTTLAMADYDEKDIAKRGNAW